MERFSVLQREVNKTTGEINVTVCDRGYYEFIIKNLNYFQLRSVLDSELSYYICKESNEDYVVKELKNKIVKDNKLYVNVRQ